MVIGTRLPWWNILVMHAPWLASVGGVAIAVSLVADKYKWKPPGAPLPYSVAGFALAIFLAFRNSASYDRWWEGRKLWGGIVNASRAFTRQVTTFVRGPEAAAVHKDIVYRHLAWLNALRAQLRGQDPFSEVKDFVDDAELERLRAQKNVAAALLHQNGVRIAEAREKGLLASDELLAAIDRSLVELVNMQGGCERIKGTPVPLAYSFFTRTFVRAYCLALPFGLVDQLGLATVIVVLALTFVLLVLETIGRILEDPFTTAPNCLPLSAICRNIEINLRQQLGERELPEPIKPENRGIVAVLT
jgi:ion channel-forming bestrophin family protein